MLFTKIKRQTVQESGIRVEMPICEFCRNYVAKSMAVGPEGKLVAKEAFCKRDFSLEDAGKNYRCIGFSINETEWELNKMLVNDFEEYNEETMEWIRKQFEKKK